MLERTSVNMRKNEIGTNKTSTLCEFSEDRKHKERVRYERQSGRRSPCRAIEEFARRSTLRCQIEERCFQLLCPFRTLTFFSAFQKSRPNNRNEIKSIKIIIILRHNTDTMKTNLLQRARFLFSAAELKLNTQSDNFGFVARRL